MCVYLWDVRLLKKGSRDEEALRGVFSTVFGLLSSSVLVEQSLRLSPFHSGLLSLSFLCFDWSLCLFLLDLPFLPRCQKFVLVFEAANDMSRIGNQSRFVGLTRKRREETEPEPDGQTDGLSDSDQTSLSMGILSCPSRLPIHKANPPPSGCSCLG